MQDAVKYAIWHWWWSMAIALASPSDDADAKRRARRICGDDATRSAHRQSPPWRDGVSRIDEMPPGRTPVDTRVVSVDRLDEVIGGLERHLATGAQAYWVCPLVAESEMSELAAAEERAALLRERLGVDCVGLVHGRMKGTDKDDVMARLRRRNRVLVATTVIEVG